MKPLNQFLRKSLLLATISSIFLTGADARTWTSADGTKTFEGELKTYDPATGMVGVMSSNGKLMKFSQKVLSPDDIAFLDKQGRVEEPLAGRSSAGKIDSDPKNLFKPVDGKPADMGKPVQVFILLGQSNMVGAGKVGGLDAPVKQEKKYPYVLNKPGTTAAKTTSILSNWTTIGVISSKATGFTHPDGAPGRSPRPATIWFFPTPRSPSHARRFSESPACSCLCGGAAAKTIL